MKPFSEFKSEPSSERFPQLPAGAYICAIRDVKEDGTFPEDSIVLRLEIIEGEWAGYYAKRYQHDTQAAASASVPYEVRYKGDFRIRAPRSENPRIRNLDWAIRSFNNAIWSIEDSNDGYHFDFSNVAALKGKLVGISVRNASFNGNSFTEIGRLESVKQVRAGKVRPMKDREDRSTGFAAAVPGEAGDPGIPGFCGPEFTVVETDELPF